MILPNFHAWWEPHGEASFFFVELLVKLRPSGETLYPNASYEVLIVSGDGSYVDQIKV